MKSALISLSLLPLLACSPDYEAAERQPSWAEDAGQAVNPYVAVTEQRLLQLDADVSGLKAAVARHPTADSMELESLLVALDQKRDDAAEQLAVLGESSEAAWDAARVHADELLDDLESAVAEAWSRIPE